MRVLAAAISLVCIATPAPAASPQVEAAVKLLQGIGKDPQRLARFCKVMDVVEGIQDRIEKLEAQVAASMEKALGENFKAYREALQKADEAADDTPDRRALNAAMDELADKCPD
jgi:Spy/CpxP family protein refolding chaperone